MSALITGAAFAWAACGQAPAGDGEEQAAGMRVCATCTATPPDDDDDDDDDGRPEAGVAAPPTALPVEMQAAIVVRPEQVMIYGELGQPDDAPPERVVLTNHTLQTVAVTNIYVADHPDSLRGEADAQFFAVAWAGLDAPDPGTFLATLRPGATMDLRVSMLRSSRQRVALLVIETGHPGFPRVVVPLSGKYFQ